VALLESETHAAQLDGAVRLQYSCPPVQAAAFQAVHVSDWRVVVIQQLEVTAAAAEDETSRFNSSLEIVYGGGRTPFRRSARW